MSNSKHEGLKPIAIIAALLLIVAVVGWFLPRSTGPSSSGLSTGAPNIEDYSPYVMQFGLNTNKAAVFGSTLAVTGAATFASTLGVTGAQTITDDLTINGRDLNVTSSNAATSTIAVGCIQTYATSTATKIVLAFGTSYTGTSTLPTGAAASAGLVAWKFGSCPQ